MARQLVRIRVQSCGNGDECPALDRRPEGGIEVTGTRIDRPGLPDHEAVVLVPDATIPDAAALVVPNLGRYIADRHRTDLLRVQTLDRYEVASDGADFERYLRGDAEPEAPGKQDWLAKLREDASNGKLRRNVHVVRAPLSAYLRYQFEWCYTYNVAAGQDIRILDVTTVPAEPLLRVGDFTVVEHEHVVRSRYDSAGRFIGAVEATADAGYGALAEIAWQLATPFSEWWLAHPEYHRGSRAA